MSIVRLQNRVSLDISNILTAVIIFTHIPPPYKSSNPDLTASSSSYITIIRLKNRVLPDTSNILAAIIIIKY